MNEVVIIGGGLAGLSLGIALRRHAVPVTVLEAGAYPRHRVCGEFIAGVEASTLQNLGIADLIQTGLSLREVVWYHRSREAYRSTLPSAAYGLSRYTLDHALARRLQKLGGEIKTNSRVPTELGCQAGWILASGRRPKKGRADWLGLKIHLRETGTENDLELHFGPRAYVGLSPVEDGAHNLCGLFRVLPEAAGRGPDVLRHYLLRNGLQRLATLLDKAQPVPNSFASVAGMDYQAWQPPDHSLCLGDACGLIPPLTGNGMSMAFESSEIALDPILQWSRGNTSWDSAIRQYNLHRKARHQTRLRVARQLQRALLSPACQRAMVYLSALRAVPFRTLYALTH